MPDPLASDSNSSQLSCTLNSARDCVHVLSSMVEVMSQRAGLNDKETNRVVLAVDELFANIGQHGYHGKEGPVEMKAKYDGDSLWFEFRDYALPLMDTDTLRGQAVDTSQIRPGGLGLHLIYAIMDEVRHQALDDGNRWSLTKHLKG
ncbi:MAG: ATP-binding protein [Mariprofundaceae bacterium]|nr:ATP-binding protein [Mariprofundaceae bacterium]